LAPNQGFSWQEWQGSNLQLPVLEVRANYSNAKTGVGEPLAAPFVYLGLDEQTAHPRLDPELRRHEVFRSSRSHGRISGHPDLFRKFYMRRVIALRIIHLVSCRSQRGKHLF
jgi:hypothetical protein